MSALKYFQFSNAKHDASTELIQFSKKRINLSYFVVIFNVVLERKLQFIFSALFLELYSLPQFLDEITLLFVLIV